MFEWGAQLNSEAQSLLVAVALTGAIVFVLMVAFRTRSIVSTLGAAIASAFLLWMVANMTVLRDKAGEEIQDGWRPPAGAVVVDV